MYSNFEYYRSEYGGTITDESVFNRLCKKVDRILDKMTTQKLIIAFPKDTQAIEAVYQCECALVDFQQAVDAILVGQAGAGYTVNSDGSVQGKVVSSISSGSESVSYSAGSIQDNKYALSAYDKDAYNKNAYEIVSFWLSGVQDDNGVGLLYAGPYPARLINGN